MWDGEGDGVESGGERLGLESIGTTRMGCGALEGMGMERSREFGAHGFVDEDTELLVKRLRSPISSVLRTAVPLRLPPCRPQCLTVHPLRGAPFASFHCGGLFQAAINWGRYNQPAASTNTVWCQGHRLPIAEKPSSRSLHAGGVTTGYCVTRECGIATVRDHRRPGDLAAC